jgi:hypothetical protein
VRRHMEHQFSFGHVHMSPMESFGSFYSLFVYFLSVMYERFLHRLILVQLWVTLFIKQDKKLFQVVVTTAPEQITY